MHSRYNCTYYITCNIKYNNILIIITYIIYYYLCNHMTVREYYITCLLVLASIKDTLMCVIVRSL